MNTPSPVYWCASRDSWQAFSEMPGAINAAGVDPFAAEARDQLREALNGGMGEILVLAEASRIGDEPAKAFAAVQDQINLSGRNPLFGPNNSDVGPRFPDMTMAFDKGRRERLESIGNVASIVVAELPPDAQADEHVVANVRRLGARAISRGLVSPVITARHAGASVAAVVRLSDVASWEIVRSWLSD